MNLDPLLPIAPARVRAVLLPLGRIKADRFASFVERLQGEHAIHLRDVTADARPNRNMFSPMAYPDGMMLYDLITYIPPPSHLALSPFDLHREPTVIIAIADGTELRDTTFSKRYSAGGTGPTVTEKNIRALYQELEDLRDTYPKALVHQVLIFDYDPPADSDIPMPEGIKSLPPLDECKRTTLKTAMCDVSSLLLAEMTSLARSFEAMANIESPGHYSVARHVNGASWGGENGPNGIGRRNSQYQHGQRPNSAAPVVDKAHARMSMPPVPGSRRPTLSSSNSTPGLQSTSGQSTPSHPPKSSDDAHSDASTGTSTPEPKASRPGTAEGRRDMSQDRVSVHGFGPGSPNDKRRIKGKGRVSVVIGSMYLQAGLWSDSLKELSEGATAARSLNDHIWHGKALELIVMNLILLGWSGLDFQVPNVCLPTQDKPNPLLSLKSEPESSDPNQPKYLRNLQLLLPELLDRIIGLYSRVSTESLPPLPFAETAIRFSKILSALHLHEGKLNQQCLDMIVVGNFPKTPLTTSPRLTVTPSRQHIMTLLFRAFPSSATELLTTSDRVSILSGIASTLGPIGLQRKKAMVIRELVSVLIGGLVEARTRGAAEAGVHPAAGLISMSSGHDQNSSAMALDLGEGDIEQGIEAFLQLLCRSYGVVEFESWSSSTKDEADTDEAVISRIQRQCTSRFSGFPSIKLNILRACINFSEALPDFNGVLKFSSDLMRTSGSGVAPGPRREDASVIVHREEQARLISNITRTSSLAQRLGMNQLHAEYWDEFLLRGIKLEPLPTTRTPIPHARSALPGAADSRASQDVNPFIYNPFLKKPDEKTADNTLVAGELAMFKATLQNTFDIEVEIESIRLDTEGVGFEAISESTTIGPYRTQVLKLKGRPKGEGSIRITGAIIKVKGCRERRFPIFSKPWVPVREEKIKTTGICHPEASVTDSTKLQPRKPEVDSVELQVIPAQPTVDVKSTSLPQSCVMILEGERQKFSVILQNKSPTPVDFMLFSFKDSTQDPLQTALRNRDATPAELYEYELILMKKQALRLPRNDQPRHIAPDGEATFDFEILGKPGLTNATIQIDYTYLGVPRDEVTEQFYTRQVSLDLTVTVNASVELARIDALPMFGQLPKSLWDRLGAAGTATPDEWCLLSMDLRNAWPSQMAVHLEGSDGMVVDENILPGNTSRVVMPVRRVCLADPHAAIPSLNPTQKRQFVVSSSKISPEMERANREAFWYRESILENLKATWRTTSLPKRSGVVELRNTRLSPRMIEAVKVDELGIEVSVEDATGDAASPYNMAYVDEFMQLKVHLTNRTDRPILPLVRLMPALRHRPLHVALDYSRKLGWNGTLQQLMPELKAHGNADFVMGVTALCRGEFEIAVSAEEVQTSDDAGKSRESGSGRGRSDTTTMMDAALGIKERRIWHARQPCILTVKDRE